MGIITSLIEANHRKKLDDISTQLGGYKMILGMAQSHKDEIKPEEYAKINEWAIDNIAALAEGKKPGAKGGGKGGAESPFKTLLKGITGGLGHLNPSPAAPKSVGETPDFAHSMMSPDEAKQQREGQATEAADTEAKREKAKKEADNAAELKKKQEEEKLETQFYEGKAKEIGDNPQLSAEQKTDYLDALAKHRYFLTGAAPRVLKIPGKSLAGTTEADGTPRQDAFGRPINPEWDYANIGGKFFPQEPASKASGSVAKDKERIALEAWAEKHGTTVDKMTAVQKQEALAAVAGTGDKGTLGELEASLRNQHPDWDDAKVKATAGKEFESNFQAGTTGKQVNIQLRREDLGLPTGASTVAPGTPASKFTAPQREAVDVATSYLSGLMSAARNKTMQRKIQDGLELISSATGLSKEEIDGRRVRRQGAQKSYQKLRLMKDSVDSLETVMARHGKILEDLRDQLPSSDIAKLNSAMLAGAREFNLNGLSATGARYALSLQAIRNEYARIIAGGTASAATTPVEAMKEAGQNISANFTKGTMHAAVQQMQTEAKQKSGGQQDELSALQSEISSPLIPELGGGSYKPAQAEPQPGGGGGPAGGEDKEYNGHKYHRDKSTDMWKLVK